MSTTQERGGARLVLTPARLVLLGAVTGAALRVRHSVRQAKRSWVAHGSAPSAVAGPVAAGSTGRSAGPGLGATHPRQITLRGWFRIIKYAWKSGGEHNAGLLAAGVTYYAFLSIFPALIAVVAVYGLVASPADVQTQVEDIASGLPQAAQDLITTQLKGLTSTDAGALSVSLVLSVGAALFTASAAINGLMGALNVVYREHDDRNIVRKRATALLLTLGAVLFVVLAAFLLTVLPAVLDAMRLATFGQVVLLGARWLGLILAFMFALAVLYRFAPDRADAKVRWVGAGAVLATALWLLASVGLSIYADRSKGYASTYGALAGAVVLMLWLYLSAYAVLLGAEVNAQSELSTAADTTTGKPQPVGDRGAYVADHVVGADGTPM